jgi:glycine/D-amino acid oxidase-like deaminating enzyme
MPRSPTWGSARATPFYTTDLPYLWGRVVADGRLILGAGLVHPADGDVRTLSLGDTVVREGLCRLETRVRGLHPTLARIEVTARWGGPIAFRRGGVPIVSRLPGLSPAIVCAAYAGHGIALGVRIGQLVAEAIVDGRAVADVGRDAAGRLSLIARLPARERIASTNSHVPSA